MIDNVYKNAFKEVYEILQNTDLELVQKVPINFINFLQTNMNTNYKTTIYNNISISQQLLLPETEDILALIYRNYWATSEEKQEFYTIDKKSLESFKENEKNKYKDVSEIFANRKKSTIQYNRLQDNSLAVIPKENFMRKILNKILKILKIK